MVYDFDSIPALLHDVRALQRATGMAYSIPTPIRHPEADLVETKVVLGAPCRRVVSEEEETFLYEDGLCVFKPLSDDP